MTVEEVARIATVTSAVTAAVALTFTAYQFFRGRYEQKAIFTVDRCKALVISSRAEDVLAFLALARAINQATDKQAAYAQTDQSGDVSVAGQCFLDELEFFAFLYRKAILNREIVDTEVGHLFCEVRHRLTGYMDAARQTTPNAFDNFLWLTDRISNRGAKKPNPARAT